MSVKQKSLILLLCLFLSLTAKAQWYELISHLGGWNSTIDKCPSRTNTNPCETFDYLCVHSGCNTLTDPLWYRIGTPSYAGPGLVAIHAMNHSVEGLFTAFNFVPGQTYYIHVGVYRTSLLNPYAPISDGSLKLLATKGIAETTADVCCSEPALWDENNDQFNFNDWYNNNGQSNPNVDGVLIGDIRPGVVSGTTQDFNVAFTVPSGTSFNQFAIHADYTSLSQFTVTLDYIIIESECAGFTYTRSTNNPIQVRFDAISPSPAASYAWDFNDGSYGSGPSVTHTYPGGSIFANSYFPCMEKSTASGGNFLCGQCRAICDIEQVFRESNSDFATNFEVTVFGPYSRRVQVNNTTGGVPLYIDWGDGNITYSPSSPQDWQHQYQTNGSYYVCLKIGDPGNISRYATTCIKVCFNDQFNPEGVDEGDEDITPGGVEGGKPAPEISQDERGGTIKGLQEKNAEHSIKIIPNPVTSIAIITMPYTALGSVKIVVYDVTGRQVIQKLNDLKKGTNKIDLDMTILTNGVYVVEINDGQQITKNKIIKQ